MLTIDVDEVIIPSNRQRTEFPAPAMLELFESFGKSFGQLQAIVLRTPENPELVAGERRLRVGQKYKELGIPLSHQGQTMPVGHLAFTYLGDLDEYSRKEAELDENIRRLDLSWQDRTRAIADLHALRQQTDPSWTLGKTAAEINHSPDKTGGAYTAEISDAVNLQNFFSDPDVQKAKSVKEAKKIVQKKLERARRAEMALDFDPTISVHTILNGDSFLLLDTLPDSHFDILLSDPPYGKGMHEHTGKFAARTTSFGAQHEYDDSREYLDRILNELIPQFARVMKPEAHIYLFCDINYWPAICAALALEGWTVWPKPLVWYKGNFGAYPDADHGPRYTTEYITYAYRGGMKVTGMYHDCITIPQNPKHDHPAGKPWEVYYDLLRRSALPGMRVLDLFAGEGPILRAAQKAKSIATAIELDPKWYHKMVEVLRNAETSPEAD